MRVGRDCPLQRSTHSRHAAARQVLHAVPPSLPYVRFYVRRHGSFHLPLLRHLQVSKHAGTRSFFAATAKIKQNWTANGNDFGIVNVFLLKHGARLGAGQWETSSLPSSFS